MKYRWIAQDEDGIIAKHKEMTKQGFTAWNSIGWKIINECYDNPNWRDSLIDRTTHDYKIEDGILIRVDKLQRHEYADVFIECANDKSNVLQFKTKGAATWHDSIAAKDEGIEWRVKPQEAKPKTKTVRFRNYLTIDDEIKVTICLLPSDFKEWLGDWQEVEIPE